MFDFTLQLEFGLKFKNIRKHDDGKPRPIVAKFLRCQDKEFIRKSAYLLKGTKF